MKSMYREEQYYFEEVITGVHSYKLPVPLPLPAQILCTPNPCIPESIFSHSPLPPSFIDVLFEFMVPF